jgi:anti-sigma B factor antagonist
MGCAMMSSEMSSGCIVKISAEGGATTAALQGELDLASITHVADILGALLDQRPDVLCVDLGGLEFLDSSGLRALLRTATRANAMGVEYRCTNPTRIVMRTMQIVNACELLGVRESGVAAR